MHEHASLAAKSWFIESYRNPIAQPSEGLFPDPSFTCKQLGVRPPVSVSAAATWYWKYLSDFGGAWVLRYEAQESVLFLVFCGTDGDEGAVEIFDSTGRPLASAFLNGDSQVWEEQKEIRRRFQDLYALDE